jgi:phosphoribosyl 1,2-cyclic phosphodiesterase
MIRFSYLGSGSKGNSALVSSGSTCIMIDCGFSVAAAEARLARLGHAADRIDALLVTHEHSDHIGGVARMARRHRIPVWMTPGTFAAAPDQDIPGLNLLNCHESLAVGDLQIEPMPVPHDAREPCQFVFSDGSRRLGILTDTGHVTRHISERLSGCDALVIECNHDLDMLMRGPYPMTVKRRVAGDLGHLNNAQSAGLVESIDTHRLQYLVAVHISETNNTRQLALQALAAALGAGVHDIDAACQNGGLDWRQID